MTKSNSQEVLCVHTAHGLEDFEIFGGTAKLKINLERAGLCGFVVCAVRAGSMPHPERHAKRVEGLTIANAKAGLSTHFGVPIEDIDITIRG